MDDRHLSSGLAGLDKMFGGVLAGDNIVWQVDTLQDFRPLVKPFCQQAVRIGKPLIYFRFGKYFPLVEEGTEGVTIIDLDLSGGFETFLFKVHSVIGDTGRGAYYLFDNLTELVDHWFSDQMLANFFMLTCPYLYDLETVTYFPILRNRHSSRATAPITETTQLFLDVHRYKERLYIRPIKVQHRYSASMHMLHAWEQGDKFVPVTQSVLISEILSSVPRPELESGGFHLDTWNRAFLDAENLRREIEDGARPPEDSKHLLYRLIDMAISREDRIQALCRQHFDLAGLISVGNRIIGSGLIGGKSVGMLLARAILSNNLNRWSDLMEKHDSFFVGSDVFYTFLVCNGCWWVRQSQRNPETFLKGSSEARRQILRGDFPDYLIRQFSDMLDYFGQSPIVVRSSSLLEDNFGNAFAGKYESVFCANQGPRAQRLRDFLSAVRTIYASSMSEDALRYRARRGLLERDEQMALLVQRVSGGVHGNLFYPDLAGVGFSFNPFVWHEDIDPHAGVLRLVFGLGTRAVDRSDDDYTRIVALNAPDRRPEENRQDQAVHAQHKVDVLNLGANQLTSMRFREVAEASPDIPLQRIATQDEEVLRNARRAGRQKPFAWTLTLDGVLKETEFAADFSDALQILHKAYDYPVDIEFTANFLQDGTYRINIVQCRPLQVAGGGAIVEVPENLSEEDVIIESKGPVIGQSRFQTIDRIIYVVPSIYGVLPVKERYAVARLIGQITRLEPRGSGKTVCLFGPGRWGTTTPSLGVPVSFAEINRASLVCEIVAMREGIVPDVSLGTHFFSDLVENEMLYMAFFPSRDSNFMRHDYFEKAKNSILEMLPDTDEEMAKIVRVIESPSDKLGRPLKINANNLKQRVVAYFHQDEANGAPAE
ncbi:MAG: PEP/pyruvate-binding domain-containing protein [Candidatus Sumerlaeia bacterium]